jgi:hypothetical protein
VAAWGSIPAALECCGFRKGFPFAKTGDLGEIAEGNPRVSSQTAIHGSARVMPFVKTYASPGDPTVAVGKAAAMGLLAFRSRSMQKAP